MLLAIDIGNTNMEFGFYKGLDLLLNFRLITQKEVTSDEVGLFATWFCNIHNIRPNTIEDVLITSVVPQVMYSVTNAIRKYFKKVPLVIGEDIDVPIVNKYGKPHEVGADRLVNAYSAYQKHKNALIVVDFGTATTFDVINDQGEYLGGTIYPGIKISMEALYTNAAKLPKIEINIPQTVIGKNTVSSMQSGLIYGYSGVVRNMVKEIERELGQKTKIIATGGLASIIEKKANVFEEIDKSLTLDGLAMIYQAYHKNT